MLSFKRTTDACVWHGVKLVCLPGGLLCAFVLDSKMQAVLDFLGDLGDSVAHEAQALGCQSRSRGRQLPGKECWGGEWVHNTQAQPALHTTPARRGAPEITHMASINAGWPGPPPPLP